MSNNKFDSKIKDRLYEHESDYEQGAWEKFQKVMPTPWYVGFWKTYGGWLSSGLLGSVLLISYLYQNKQNDLLNDEISTLNNKIELLQNTSPKVVEVVTTDTVFLTREVVKFKYLNTLASNEGSVRITPNSGDILPYSDKQGVQKDKIATNTTVKVGVGNNTETVKPKVAGSQTTGFKDQKSESIIVKTKEETSTISDKESIAKTTIEEDATDKKDVETEKTKVEDAELAKTEIIEKETTNPEQKKKNAFRFPTMRVGLTSDYLGFNVLANGIGGEVFFNDKLSFSTGVLFSKGVESKHPLERDFNAKTGKNFQREFEKYNPQIEKGVRDITIETSFLKMPLNLNYYINTWSRFKFIVSAGTKLDLAVFQDVNFISGINNEVVANRFEAKPKAQVLNSFNYGMGVQYQYGSIVAQLTPYFDYKFRNTEYFKPNKNFGITGSIKYEFGK